jgi:alpha-ketoglutarate-dependent taurine dioxygenase
MSETGVPGSTGPGIGAARRRVVSSQPQEMVEVGPLRAGEGLPLLVRPRLPGVHLATWARENRAVVELHLHRAGALLFRGFDLKSVEEFEQVALAISHELAEYRFRASPRTTVKDRIYTSTDYPAVEEIFPHNEHSYSPVFPLRLYFYCVTPPATGGETPIGDTRRVNARVPEEIRERFRRLGILYVRNYGDGMGLPWQTVFQTEDPAAVGEYCRQHGIEMEWKGDGRLRTRQIGPAIVRHPRTGEEIWFNHATFFHVSSLPAAVRDSLLRQYAAEDLPNQTFYGDGSAIEPEVLAALQQAYRAEMVAFPWETGDLLLLDNMLAYHGRRPFTGARKVVVAMAEPCASKDLHVAG